MAITLLGTAGAVVLHRGESVKFERQGPLYKIVSGDELYQFDAVWRDETFWRRDAATGSWSRVQDPPADRVERLRTDLLLRSGYPTVDEIPVEGERAIQALRSLGYI